MAKEITDIERRRDSELLTKRSLQVQRGAARAAVLGVNDGLVSTLCIVLAVAGAGASQDAVLLAGFAGLIAGAISMAAGEWISVTSQVELFKGILNDLKKLAKRDRILLTDQLADSFGDTGIKKATAVSAAQEVSKKDDMLSTVYASQVMGMNPDELGSPWTAAFSSLLLFSMGALVPLVPWIFNDGQTAIIMSTVFTGIAGLVVGGYVGKTSGGSIAYSAFRQLMIILLAATVTYGIGYVFGVAVT